MSRDTNGRDFRRRGFLKSIGTVGLAASIGIQSWGSAAAVEVGQADNWTREEASRIELTDANTAPVIDHDPPQISEEEWVWDTWPLRNRDGSITKINGWQIIFSLTAYTPTPGGRHGQASIRYFYSRDGKSWQPGGEVFENGLGHHQWAGSAMYDQSENQIYLFYTAVSSQETNFRQRLALGKGAGIETGPDGVELSGTFDHTIMAEADGTLYQTLGQSLDQGIIYAFRDPWYFQHPETGEDLILFEGNTPIIESTSIPDEQAGEYTDWNGNVGLAKATSDDLTEWELMPPILNAIETNQQLERPHFVFRRGKYYLFFPSHQFTFAPGLSGPDGLYGFVGDSLYGDYEPLNESGLVIGNPESQPFQAYSWLALPHGDNIVVTSFDNFRGLDDTSMGEIDLTEVGFLPPEEQRSLFGGTLAPSLKVHIDGTETSIQKELKDGYFPPSIGAQYKGNANGKRNSR